MKKYLIFLVTFLYALFSHSALAAVWTIVIDPGHGGKDPGAISPNLKLYEKNITLSIARELKAILDKDPNFRAVLTRTGDYYISVPDRSGIARKKRANYLVSIHADSSTNKNLRGASVWVLSNRRASSEMGQWLEDHEKQSELLGGAGKVLAGHSDEKYLNQTVLDLQFGHSQREGYKLGSAILRNFSRITQLSKNQPQHASLGVLRSPDIPSVLVETGFLSNKEEETKLASVSYRRRIAYIIYQGIVEYRNKNLGIDTNTSNKGTAITAIPDPNSPKKINVKMESKVEKQKIADSGQRHTVKSGETIAKIATLHGVKASEIIELNGLKRKDLYIGEKIKIPAKTSVKTAEKNKEPAKSTNKTTVETKPIAKTNNGFYTVKSGDTAYRVALNHGISVDELMKFNNLKKPTVWVGQKLRVSASNSNAGAKSSTPEKSKVQEKPKAQEKTKGTTKAAISKGTTNQKSSVSKSQGLKKTTTAAANKSSVSKVTTSKVNTTKKTSATVSNTKKNTAVNKKSTTAKKQNK